MKTSDQIGAEIKSYRSRTLQGALLLVREELGPDASVLETREVWDGVFGQRQFEVLASDQVQVPSRFKDSMRADVAEEVAASVFDRQIGSSRFSHVSDTAFEIPEAIVPVHDEDLRASLRQGLRESTEGWDSCFDEVTYEIHEHELLEEDFEDTVDDDMEEVIEATAVDESGMDDPKSEAVADKADDVADDAVAIQAVALETAVLDAALEVAATDLDEEAAEDVQAVREPDETLGLSPTLSSKLAELIDANMDAPTASEIIQTVKQDIEDDGELGELDSKRAVRRRLLAVLESQLEVRAPIEIQEGQQNIVALIGPTGMGKTTTVAKLAAHFKLEKQCRVGLITVDTYRVAAVDQLRTYANIMELPLVVATTPAEMERAIDELADCELVLIDTAGCSPQDEERMEDLEQLLDAADADDVQLVVGATLSRAAMELATLRFSDVGASAMILTKLDEASGLGDLVRTSREGGLPFTYVCEGQEVPNDIEPANATRLARRIAGSRRK